MILLAILSASHFLGSGSGFSSGSGVEIFFLLDHNMTPSVINVHVNVMKIKMLSNEGNLSLSFGFGNRLINRHYSSHNSIDLVSGVFSVWFYVS